MDFHQKMLRIAAEGVFSKMAADIRKDKERGIRNAIEMADYFAKDKRQKHLLDLAKAVAAKPAYNRLISRMFDCIDPALLKTVIINLSISSMTHGAQQLAEDPAAGISWLGRIASDASCEKGLIDRDVKRGTYAFFAEPADEAALACTLDTAASFRDCTFFVAAQAFLLQCKSTAMQATRNIVALFDLAAESAQQKADACRAFAQHGLLYGIIAHYGENLTGQLRQAVDLGCFAAVFAGGDDGGQYREVCDIRRQGELPLLLFDLRRDADAIMQSILEPS